MSTTKEDLVARLKARLHSEDLTGLLVFRETFLAPLTARLQADLRAFGTLIAFLASEYGIPPAPATPEATWRVRIRGVLADLRDVERFLGDLSRDLLAADPGSAAHRRAQAMGEITAEIARGADHLAALLPRPGKAAPGPEKGA